MLDKLYVLADKAYINVHHDYKYGLLALRPSQKDESMQQIK